MTLPVWCCGNAQGCKDIAMLQKIMFIHKNTPNLLYVSVLILSVSKLAIDNG